VPQFNKKEMHLELQHDFNYLSKFCGKYDEDLQLNGMVYSFCSGVIEETVPSSDPSSEVGMQMVTDNTPMVSTCKNTITSRSISFQNDICDGCIHFSHLSRYILEPLFMTSFVENGILHTEDLARKLAFMDILDPSEETAMVVADVYGLEKCIPKFVSKQTVVEHHFPFSSNDVGKFLDDDYISCHCFECIMPYFPEARSEDADSNQVVCWCCCASGFSSISSLTTFAVLYMQMPLDATTLCIQDIGHINGKDKTYFDVKDSALSVEMYCGNLVKYEGVSAFGKFSALDDPLCAFLLLILV